MHFGFHLTLLFLATATNAERGIKGGNYDPSFSYQCKANEILSMYNETDERVLTQCAAASICGVTKTCILATGSNCTGSYRYVKGVERHSDKSLLLTCCQVTPIGGNERETCRSIQVVDRSIEEYVAKHRLGQSQASSNQPKSAPSRASDQKAASGAGAQPFMLTSSFLLVKASEKHIGAEFVKSIARTAKGMIVTVCSIRCDSSASRATTLRDQKQVTTVPTKVEERPAKKGIFGLKGTGHGCFSGDMTVITSVGTKMMSQLHVDDQVLAQINDSSQQFQPIEWFYHRDPDHFIKYINLKTRSGHRLSVTPNHLIPFVPCALSKISVQEMNQLMSKAVFASRAKPGMCLAVQGDDGGFRADVIVQVTSEQKTGVFSPITRDGTIVVNGIQASCYSSLENHPVQKCIHGIIIKINRVLERLRSILSVDAVVDQKNKEKGIPWILGFLLKIAEMIMPAFVFSLQP